MLLILPIMLCCSAQNFAYYTHNYAQTFCYSTITQYTKKGIRMTVCGRVSPFHQISHIYFVGITIIFIPWCKI